MPIYKLKTTDKRKFNSKAHIPYAEPQIVEFDAEGNFEANLKDEDEVSLLLDDVSDFLLADGKELITVTEEDVINNGIVGLKPGDKVIAEPMEIEPQTEENELGKSEDDKNDIGNPGEEDDLSVLDTLSINDLKQLAEDNFPNEDWQGLEKEELKEYLKNKLSEAA